MVSGEFMSLRQVALMMSFLSSLTSAEVLKPSDVVNVIYRNNPELASSKAQAQAEKELISSQYSLSSPMIGYMKETDMSLMQQQDGPMKTWSVSQEFMFPTKYFSRGKIQEARASKAMHEYMYKKLEVRGQALTSYFRFYSAKRILGMLEAQRETLREIARIVEARRAAGSVPQQDEMKAHVEQTKIENQILLQGQEEAEAKFALNSALNRSSDAEISIPESDFTAKKDVLISENLSAVNIETSHHLRGVLAMTEEFGFEKGLAKMSYLPDFQLSYRQVFGGNHPSSGRAIGLEMTFPLWFFSKENSELASAVSKELAARRELESHKRSTESMLESLKSKVKTLSKLLDIYETALIPQATSSLNSSRSAYSAGKVGFQDLLDAERTLYSTRIEYYENFSKFIEAVTSFEREAGVSVSALPFEETM